MKYFILKIETNSVDSPCEPTYVSLFSSYEKALEHSNKLKNIYNYKHDILEIEIDKTHNSCGTIFEGVF